MLEYLRHLNYILILEMLLHHIYNLQPAQQLVKQYLMRDVQVPDYKADVCVAFARGNVGRAKALASSEEFDNIKQDAVALLKYIREMEITDIPLSM